jgi:hypothetical protein
MSSRSISSSDTEYSYELTPPARRHEPSFIPEVGEESAIVQGGLTGFSPRTRGSVQRHAASAGGETWGKANAERNRFFTHFRYSQTRTLTNKKLMELALFVIRTIDDLDPNKVEEVRWKKIIPSDALPVSFEKKASNLAYIRSIKKPRVQLGSQAFWRENHQIAPWSIDKYQTLQNELTNGKTWDAVASKLESTSLECRTRYNAIKELHLLPFQEMLHEEEPSSAKRRCILSTEPKEERAPFLVPEALEIVIYTLRAFDDLFAPDVVEDHLRNYATPWAKMYKTCGLSFTKKHINLRGMHWGRQVPAHIELGAKQFWENPTWKRISSPAAWMPEQHRVLMNAVRQSLSWPEIAKRLNKPELECRIRFAVTTCLPYKVYLTSPPPTPQVEPEPPAKTDNTVADSPISNTLSSTVDDVFISSLFA